MSIDCCKEYLKIRSQQNIQSFLSRQMGSSAVKDANVDLYMSTNKQYYIAGDYVEGEVYLNVKTNRAYSNLCIKLEGIEHVYWTTGSGKNRRTHQNTYKSYDFHNLLVDFHGTANQGQYLFPFSLLLPTMMSGSFLFSQNCYIKYILKAELVHQTEENQTQRFEMYLNILEPPRMPVGSLAITNTINSKCCGCCSDYGNISISLSCNKNFVLNGDSIQIAGAINNSQGKEKIQSWKLVLEEVRYMISSGGRTRSSIDNTYNMHQNQNVGEIQPGAVKQFNINGIIPLNIMNYTAIGRVVARYYLLHLYTDYGCCTTTAGAILHLIVHSKTPMIVEKKPMPPPQNWNPQIFPKIICHNMKPYMYNPLAQLQYLNMPGSNNIVMNGYDNTEADFGYNKSYQMTNNFKMPSSEGQYMNYNPVFYNQELFTDAERQQQGYQPYFGGQNAENNNIVRKL